MTQNEMMEALARCQGEMMKLATEFEGRIYSKQLNFRIETILNKLWQLEAIIKEKIK